jgi:Restriction endonuclease
MGLSARHGGKMARYPCEVQMSRRKRKTIQPTELILAALCLFVVGLFLKEPSALIILALAAVACFVLLILIPVRGRRRVIEKANTVVDRNAERLARRRAQLCRQDAYGKTVLDRWSDEINYLIDQHVKPSLTSREQLLLHRQRRAITNAIMKHVERVTHGRPVFETFSGAMTPAEFEVFCAEQLRQGGWNASVTRPGRDQGVDVVAEKEGLRLVLQCKLYSDPVGNKAVQEAVAARGFEQAHYCAVVSNSSYTSAAEQLASTNKVLLLHYSDLRRIETILRGAGAPIRST